MISPRAKIGSPAVWGEEGWQAIFVWIRDPSRQKEQDVIAYSRRRGESLPSASSLLGLPRPEASASPQEFSAFLVSLLVHLCALVVLGLLPTRPRQPQLVLAVQSLPVEEPQELRVPEAVQFRELKADEVGAASAGGLAAAMSLAPQVSEVSIVPSPWEAPTVDLAPLEVNQVVETASARFYHQNLVVRGAAGEGTTGAEGAIDRITHEILLSLEERKTLVVWMFDQTASLVPQRQALRQRLDRIYQELGIFQVVPQDASVKDEDKPLLSAVIGFGQSFQVMTLKPTDQIAQIQRALADLPLDDSGTENVFAAVLEAARRYARYRHTTPSRGEPERNVMLVVFTDEAGSDPQHAEEAIKMCRRWAMPVYVVGVPAPFGQRQTRMKWIDPDPRYSQEVQWGIVEQGPETPLPELVRIAFADSGDYEEPIDSGFGPFALTRLCYETGGIYFAVHPNRELARPVRRHEIAPYSSYLARFFDPEVMRKYKPEYVSLPEYQKRISQNKARWALVQAASSSQELRPMENPVLRFVKRGEDEAEFVQALSAAQQAAAALEPKINALYQILQQGEADRDKETVLRWQAGYDLAMGRTLAVKVRTETYNAMLAAAKRGLKFANPKNNTWVLRPSDEISVGSQYAKLAERARMYLTRVIREHPDTPWAMLAQRELSQPLGWSWREEFTDLSPRPPAPMASNNAPATPAPERPVMLPPPPPRRPLPNL
jgi:hypothetical protein